MAKRRPGFGAAFFTFFAIIPKTRIGWTHLFRRFALWRSMVAEFLRGKTRAPWGTILAIAAILLYVLLPFDLIPDFLLFFGWLDDAFIVAKLFSLVKIDLRRFIKQRNVDPEPFDLQDKP